MKNNACQYCGGTGSFQGRMSQDWPNCPECNGSGTTEPKVSYEELISRRLFEAGFIITAQATALTQTREALIDAVAHLAAAVSAYEKFVGNVDCRGIRDALYKTRTKDFQNAIVRARENLVKLDSTIADLATKW
jgi:hypothetical protein